MNIHYVIGDATDPLGARPILLPHICNDIGGWGEGFVLAISKRWKAPELEYAQWCNDGTGFELGAVQFVEVESGLTICNMIGQRDIYPEDGIPPIRYDALEACLVKVGQKAKELNATVHMPRIGAGLAGGDWKTIASIVERVLCNNGIHVTVYTLPKS